MEVARALASLRAVVGASRKVEAEMLRRIAEVDRERHYLHEAVPSMFAYMTQRLGFAEGAAYKRIRVARLSLDLPQVLDALESGRVHLSGLHVLASVLSPDNVSDLLGWAEGKSKKLIEARVDQMRRESGARPPAARPRVRPVEVDRKPAPTVPAPSLLDVGRAVPGTHQSGAQQSAAESTPVPAPAATSLKRPEPTDVLFQLSLTMSAAVRAKWEKAAALMARRGGAEGVLEAALDLLIEKLEKERFGAEQSRQSKASAQRTRHIPNAIKRAVYERDQGRCTFTDPKGHRCNHEVVEFHHVDPFGKGGAHSVANLTMRCPQHNTLAAEEDYGQEKMRSFRVG